MPRYVSAFVVLCWLGLTSGCVTNQSIPDLPATLGDQGLMVARLYVPGTLAWENARINIDGKLYPASLREGYVAVALDAGEHDFVQLRVEGQQLSRYEPDDAALRKVRGGGGGGYRAPVYVPGSSYTVYFTTLTVNRHFKVEAGKIVNLGLIVYVPAREDANQKNATTGKGKQFYTVTLDNNVEMSSYLRTNYPTLMASLKDSSITMAPATYLEANRLPDLRRLIASHEITKGRLVASSGLTAAYGDAGTIVVFKSGGKDGKLSADVLDTGTLTNIVDAQPDGDRLVFLAADGKVYTFEQGKLSKTAIPFPLHAVRLGVMRSHALAVVDNRLRIAMSSDGGTSWTKYEGSMVEKPRSDMGVASDGEGVYVYAGNRGLPSSILYLRPNDAKAQVIPGPVQNAAIPSTSFSYPVARESGIFLIYKERDFYFRSRTPGEGWSVRSKPGNGCRPIVFDTTGRKLKVECDGASYESDNGGSTWTKVSV
ncbi:MAG: hypothetical protein ACJ8J7_06215 [Sulfurifustaceae bacterium]